MPDGPVSFFNDMGFDYRELILLSTGRKTSESDRNRRKRLWLSARLITVYVGV